MSKILISIPDELAMRMKAVIPTRQRSKVITQLLEKEVQQREGVLYDCARHVDTNLVLREEMAEWEVTVQDGLKNDDK